MATRTRKTGTGKASMKPRRSSRGSSAKAAAPQLSGVSAAERRSQAQEEARWRAESDLRTLRQAARKFAVIPAGSSGQPPWQQKR
jgi:hypothetical protein